MPSSNLRITLGVAVPLVTTLIVFILAYICRHRHQAHRSSLGRSSSQSSTRKLTENRWAPDHDDPGIIETGTLHHLLDPQSPSSSPSHILRRPEALIFDPILTSGPIRSSTASSPISRTHYRHDMSTGLPLTTTPSCVKSQNTADTQRLGPVLVPNEARPPPMNANEDILLPPTPLYLASERSHRRITLDVPVDLDEQGNSLKISRWKGLPTA